MHEQFNKHKTNVNMFKSLDEVRCNLKEHGNYDRHNDRPVNQPTDSRPIDQQTDLRRHSEVTLSING